MKLPELIVLIGREKKAKSGDPNYKFIAAAYNNLVALLKSKIDPNTTITTRTLDSIEGITPHMKAKLSQLLFESADLRSSSSATTPKHSQQHSSQQKLLEKLDDLLGIGEKRAQQLVDMGLKDLADLKKKEWQEKLPLDAQYFLKYKPLRKIPHHIIQSFEKYFRNLLRSLKLDIVFTGSYRRKKPFSRDVDVMVVSEDPDILDKIVQLMQKKSVLHIYAQGKDKVAFLMEIIEGHTKKYIKVDIFRTLPENRIPMLTYSTGSKNFNIKMRSIAKRHGYMLNQMGLYRNGEEVPVWLETEKDLFDALGMKYLEPHQRDM